MPKDIDSWLRKFDKLRDTDDCLHDEKRALFIEALSSYSAERDETAQKYSELLQAVENKYEGETRHETALRFIENGQELAKGWAGRAAIKITKPPPL